jgi:hypothetical protein
MKAVMPTVIRNKHKDSLELRQSNQMISGRRTISPRSHKRRAGGFTSPRAIPMIARVARRVVRVFASAGIAGLGPNTWARPA